MNFRKLIGLGGLLGVLIAGIWLVSSSSQLGIETTARQDAIRQLAGPAGVGEFTSLQDLNAEANGAVEPVVVSMSDVPVGIPDPDNMYERWIAGEIDLENEERLTPAEMSYLRQQALSLPADTDIEIMNEAVGGGNLAAGVAFESLDFVTGSNGSTPPDPEITAGHNFVIAVVNTSFEIYHKDGSVARAATSFASFLSSSNCPGAFDPVVVFDEEYNRYVMGVDSNGTRFCFAVSQTEDALGDWNIYSFVTGGGGVFFDYPHIGVGKDAIFMGSNNFGPTFVGGMWAYDKVAMYNGVAASSASFDITDGDGTPFPLNLHGWHGDWPSSHYFVTDPYDGETLHVREWPNALNGGVPTIVATINMATETGVASGQPIDTPQDGPTNIQANDWRSRDFEYHEGSGWWTDSISCNPGGGTVNCVRWAEIDLSSPTPSFIQGGVEASNGDYRIFPNLAVNACGDMLVGYSKSNTSIFPSVYVAGREAGDPAGTLQDEVLLKAGEVAYSGFDAAPHRFGDYSGMAIDPYGYDFWYLGEYSKDLATGTKWATYIGSFSFPGCELSLESYLLYLPIISTP